MANKKKNNKNNKNNNKKISKKSNNIILPVIAAVVIVAAVLTVVIPKLSSKDEGETQSVAVTQETTQKAKTGDIVIDESTISTTASFYDYDAGGTTVELFAVRASDGTIRLALNTCQVCNGSPYAYFVQQGSNFICQNCKNVFAQDSIGTVHGGCNPVPITEDDYVVEDGKITVSAEFLNRYAPNFKNWKKF